MAVSIFSAAQGASVPDGTLTQQQKKDAAVRLLKRNHINLAEG
jgi:hypothetical protein